MRLSATQLVVGATVIAAILIATYPDDAQAIPAWTRKHKLPCTSCHFGSTNRLTKFGRDFQWRGYRTADTESLSDDNSPVLTDYLSFASKFRFESDKDASPKTKFDVEALSIYMGGPLYQNLSFFFEIYLHERGKESNSTGTGNTDTAVREKLAEAYLFYNSKPDADTYWFARAGSVTPRSIHNLSTGGRNSISRPAVLNDDDGTGNLFTPRDRFYGITAGAVHDKKTRFEFGITNGGGGNKRPNQPENNDFKDLFFSVERDLDDDGSYAGVFGYRGRYPVAKPGGPAGQFADQKFDRFGLFAALEKDRFNASAGYFWGKNELEATASRSPKGYFIEGGVNVGPNTTAYGRYDRTDWDTGTTKTGYAIGLSQRLSSVGRAALELAQSKVTGAPNKQTIMFEVNWIF
ncbi:MAG: hypothetical protein AMXMBFR81_18020 [Chthonomonas sp.]